MGIPKECTYQWKIATLRILLHFFHIISFLHIDYLVHDCRGVLAILDFVCLFVCNWGDLTIKPYFAQRSSWLAPPNQLVLNSGCLSKSLHLKHANWLISCRQLLSGTLAGWGSTAFAGSSGFLIVQIVSSKAFAEHRIWTFDLPFGSRLSWPVDHRGSSIYSNILLFQRCFHPVVLSNDTLLYILLI